MKQITRERILSVAAAAGALAGSYTAYRYGKNPANKPLTFWQGQAYNTVGAFAGTIFAMAITNSNFKKIW